MTERIDLDELDAGDADEDGPNPGVELGTMANYLLEVNKAQQEHIADLTARVDDLEARLEALEADGTDGGPNA